MDKPAHSADYAAIAREFLAMHGVYRYHLRRIADMDDGEVKSVCHWWYTENGMEKEYRAFENRKLGIDPGRWALPANKSDTAAVQWLERQEPQSMLPLLPELMEWLRDCNWPVAQALLPLLTQHGAETARLAADILKPDQTDEIWKYWIVSIFTPALPPEHRRVLTDEIRRIAYRPTDGERAEEVDEAAREYLSRYA